jgi:hypothetical protein
MSIGDTTLIPKDHGDIIVEVILRYFHRRRYMSSITVVLLFEGLRSHKVLVVSEYGGHEDLCGSGRRSVIPYVHG